MKTDIFGIDFSRLSLAVLPMLLILAVTRSFASWNFSADLDARLTEAEDEEIRGHINILGLSLRKTVSDDSGDRLILFALFEAHEDFSERMFHEAYIRLKGPMSRWNVTLGRFGLPFGLLTDFTTSRLLYESLTPQAIGMDVDSGIMVSGILKDIEYGFSATQGYGGHTTPEFTAPKAYSGRTGITLGDSGDIRVGVSGFYGKTQSEHHQGHSIDRKLASLDLTLQPGRWTTRFEIQTGEIDAKVVSGAFVMLDYAVFPDWDITAAARVLHSHQSNEGYGYLGLGYRTPWCMIRGGYTYAHQDKDHHSVSIQIYRMVSTAF